MPPAKLQTAGEQVLAMLREAQKVEGVRPKPTLHTAVEAFQSAGRTRSAKAQASARAQKQAARRSSWIAGWQAAVAVCVLALCVARTQTAPTAWRLAACASASVLLLLVWLLWRSWFCRSTVVRAAPPPLARLRRSATRSLAELSSPGSPLRRSSRVSYSRLSQTLPAAATTFVGTWSVVAIEDTPGANDAYLRKLGVGWALRKLAATLKPKPTFSIENGVLHATTPGAGGVELHDVFATGRELTIQMMGRDVQVTYAWEAEALVASMRSPELAGGQPIEIRRWVDPQSHLLLAKSSCGDASCTRSYRRVSGS